MSTASETPSPDDLQRTPLFALHRELGGRMVPFAGYLLPVQYEGIIAEHRWTREHAGLFDVSHMGQRRLVGPAVAVALEALTPGSFATLAPGRVRYTLLLSDTGGTIDDLMVIRFADEPDALGLVVNAGRKAIDDAWMRERLPAGATLEALEDRALLALQGPEAERALARHCPDARRLVFMDAVATTFDGIPCRVSRSGYTGEDGFEIAVPAEAAEQVARALLAEPEVKPVGLGARDSLRLEAGMPLYGHELDETISPVEAGLSFAVAPSRRASGGFPGAHRILAELRDGPPRRRIGLRPAGRAPLREGAELLGPGGGTIGRVTSGGFAPSLDAPVAMALVAAPYMEAADVAVATRRGTERAAIVPLPFVPPRYRRGPKA